MNLPFDTSQAPRSAYLEVRGSLKREIIALRLVYSAQLIVEITGLREDAVRAFLKQNGFMFKWLTTSANYTEYYERIETNGN